MLERYQNQETSLAQEIVDVLTSVPLGVVDKRFVEGMVQVL